MIGKLTNLSENLIIIIVVGIMSTGLGATTTYYVMKASYKQSTELLIPTITEAIKRETTSIKNEITHDISVQVDKIKKSDSLNINLSQSPTNNQKPDNNITQDFKGCSDGFICIKKENLTRRQKRRLGVN